MSGMTEGRGSRLLKKHFRDCMTTLDEVGAVRLRFPKTGPKPLLCLLTQ